MTTTYCHDGYCKPISREKKGDHSKMTLSEFIIVSGVFLSTLIIFSFVLRTALEKIYTILFN